MIPLTIFNGISCQPRFRSNLTLALPESARGDLDAAPRMWDMRFAGVFIYDGGSQKTLTIYWAFSPID